MHCYFCVLRLATHVGVMFALGVYSQVHVYERKRARERERERDRGREWKGGGGGRKEITHFSVKNNAYGWRNPVPSIIF